MRRSQDRKMEHARHSNIVDVPAPAGDQSAVLAALNAWPT
jgi:hypothetical protein